MQTMSTKTAQCSKNIWNHLIETPLINLSSVTKNKNVTIFGKAEFMNPSGKIQ